MMKRKKRSWGKTHREAITIIDRNNVEETLHEIASELKNTSKTLVRGPDTDKCEVDLYHPELMDNDKLVECLKRMKVPIPVYANGTPSRVRLLYLFRKHVTPQPQRTRSLMHKTNTRRQENTFCSTGAESMDVDVSASNDVWAVNSDGTWSTSLLQRKRKLHNNLDAPLPPSKKHPVEVPCSSFSKITVSGCETRELGIAQEQTVPQRHKVVRLKRPGKSDVEEVYSHSHK